MEKKNYRGISFISITAIIYKSMLLNCIYPEIEMVLRKIQNVFRRRRPTSVQSLTGCRIIGNIKATNLNTILLFYDFSKVFRFILSGKLEEILLNDVISTETEKSHYALQHIFNNAISRYGYRLFLNLCKSAKM